VFTSHLLHKSRAVTWHRSALHKVCYCAALTVARPVQGLSAFDTAQHRLRGLGSEYRLSFFQVVSKGRLLPVASHAPPPTISPQLHDLGVFLPSQTPKGSPVAFRLTGRKTVHHIACCLPLCPVWQTALGSLKIIQPKGVASLALSNVQGAQKWPTCRHNNHSHVFR
jgi:hypothetical protein